MNIQFIPAQDRYFKNHGWLQTYHLFSFADYYDPQNLHFGELRVFNDDTIAGQSGFGAHSHDNMEIVTIVFEGELTHQDSMGNTGTIKAGEVQYMSAGTGVTHAELNQGQQTVRLYQIWMLPRQQNLTPTYQQQTFNLGQQNNRLIPLASGYNHDQALSIQTDSVIYQASLKRNQEIQHSPLPNHGIFIYIRKGQISIDNLDLNPGDQARITFESHEELNIKARSDSDFIVIETKIS